MNEPSTALMDQKLTRKLEYLRSIIQGLGRVLVAFSGGVDSSLLLVVSAQTLGPENVTAIIGHSPLRPAREYEQAAAFAEELGVSHSILQTGELSEEKFLRNPPDRCYYCKKELLTEMMRIARNAGISTVVEGSNEDDSAEYRPGSRAVQEMGVRSPLHEAHLTKDEIRCISRDLGLSTWDKPAEPCLATRFPYGEPLVAEHLRMVEAGESLLLERGFRYVRLRYHRNLGRIETAPEEIERLLDPTLRTEIIEGLKELGFTYLALDLQGYRSGSMDEGLEIGGEKSSLK